MKFSFRRLHTSLIAAVFVSVATSVLSEDSVRVSNNAKTISALFPVNLRPEMQTQTDRTAAGQVTSYFYEYYGDGIVLAGSGADIPGIARLAGANRIYEESKNAFLQEARGTETGFTEAVIKGFTGRLLLYKGNAYRGKGNPYQGRALFLRYKKRMYILNSVISKNTAANRAKEKKMFDSIEIAK